MLPWLEYQPFLTQMRNINTVWNKLLASVTYSENNIPETCQGTKLSKMRDPEKCLMINGTVDT